MKENLQAMLELFADTLASDDTVMEYQKARADYFTDGEFVKKLGQYNAMKAAYDQEMQNDTHEGDALERLDKRVKELYEQITSDPRHERLSKAEDELNALLSTINETLMSAVTGSSCGGNCSSCHSDCNN